ncbi:putative misato Segment II tubulin-like domain, DML1/Misato, tubulin domain-containing protein [Helianthus annuus]|nr:putative misato Segment II tubulin-like domain, DML1/Misato, tubulin domain-containing protein [Helianthus annuus]
MKELVTFQAGSYANFIGSHFWNFQDEMLGLFEDPQAHLVFKNQNLDMDVLYRNGETQQGIPTYTPRLISVDFQGSLGSMSSHGTLYNHNPSPSSGVATWTGNVSTQASEPHKKNLFLQRLYDEGHEINESEILDTDVVKSLEDGVQYWTDFSKVHYHPQSLFKLNGLWMDPKEFNNYGIGRNTVSEGLQGDEINERLRFFMEECDHVQGIQFMVDDSGGFSGVAASLLENIADEYTNVPVLLFSVRSPNYYNTLTSRKLSIVSNLHDAVSFSALSSLCKLIVPVGLPSLNESRVSQYLNVEDVKLYQSSAVYASAIHSINLPFRMKKMGPTDESSNESGAMDLYECIQMLAGQGMQNTVAILDAAMPPPSMTGKRFQQPLLGNLHPLTPETAHDVDDSQAIETLMVHGALGAGEKEVSVSEVREAVETEYENTSSTRPRFSHLSVSHCPLPIPLPFPSIFNNLVGRRGDLLSNCPTVSESPSRRGPLDVHSIPMAARLRSTTAVLPFLENRLGYIRKFGIERGSIGANVLTSWGFGREEIEDIGENLSKMVLALNPQQDYSSDDSD